VDEDDWFILSKEDDEKVREYHKEVSSELKSRATERVLSQGPRSQGQGQSKRKGQAAAGKNKQGGGQQSAPASKTFQAGSSKGESFRPQGGAKGKSYKKFGKGKFTKKNSQ
jgi:hypothetical protein